MTIKITGTGSVLPERVMTNAELEQMVETSDEWIRERTGIKERRIAAQEETVASLAAEAGKRALEDAGKNPEEVELIIVASCSAEMRLPCCACQVQSMIGAKTAVCFDLNAACSGFLFALNTAQAYIGSGMYRNALVVGSEVLSKMVDWTDRGTCILFGDGAGAVFVERATQGEGILGMAREKEIDRVGCGDENVGMAQEKETDSVGCGDENVGMAQEKETDSAGCGEGILGMEQGSNGFLGAVLSCGTGEQEHIQMDGREVYKFAVRQVPDCIKKAVENAGVSLEEIDYFVLHQANVRILEAIGKRLNVPMEKIPVNLDRVGNMSSASIPVLLDEIHKCGKIKAGQKIVLSGFGAGLTYGACVMTWG